MPIGKTIERTLIDNIVITLSYTEPYYIGETSYTPYNVSIENNDNMIKLESFSNYWSAKTYYDNACRSYSKEGRP